MKMQELWDKINNEDAQFLNYLYCRWQDEKQYEDINDYLDAIKEKVPEAFKITKRPFGITCKCDDGLLVVDVLANGQYLKFRGKFIGNV